MNLRQRFEQQYGKVTDEFFQHVLDLALDDQKQYGRLAGQARRCML